jgi:4-alpha-glucanotransferase
MLPHEHAARFKTEDVLACAVYAYLARTPSQLMTIPLEDLLGDVDSPNLPGAPADAYPIWRRKAGRPDSSLEQWRRDRRVKSIVDAIHTERP